MTEHITSTLNTLSLYKYCFKDYFFLAYLLVLFTTFSSATELKKDSLRLSTGLEKLQTKALFVASGTILSNADQIYVITKDKKEDKTPAIYVVKGTKLANAEQLQTKITYVQPKNTTQQHPKIRVNNKKQPRTQKVEQVANNQKPVAKPEPTKRTKRQPKTVVKTVPPLGRLILGSSIQKTAVVTNTINNAQKATKNNSLKIPQISTDVCLNSWGVLMLQTSRKNIQYTTRPPPVI